MARGGERRGSDQPANLQQPRRLEVNQLTGCSPPARHPPATQDDNADRPWFALCPTGLWDFGLNFQSSDDFLRWERGVGRKVQARSRQKDARKRPAKTPPAPPHATSPMSTGHTMSVCGRAVLRELLRIASQMVENWRKMLGVKVEFCPLPTAQNGHLQNQVWV